jgi:glutathione peroxidase
MPDTKQTWSSWAFSKIGYETIPEDVKNKSFYDLKAELPGQDRVLDMVSMVWFQV